MSKHEDTERGGQSNSGNSEEKDWSALKTLSDNAKTTKKLRPVSDIVSVNKLRMTAACRPSDTQSTVIAQN